MSNPLPGLLNVKMCYALSFSLARYLLMHGMCASHPGNGLPQSSWGSPARYCQNQWRLLFRSACCCLTIGLCTGLATPRKRMRAGSCLSGSYALKNGLFLLWLLSQASLLLWPSRLAGRWLNFRRCPCGRGSRMRQSVTAVIYESHSGPTR